MTACVDRNNDLSQAPEDNLIKLSGISSFNWQDAYVTIFTDQPVNLLSADYAPLKYDKHMVLYLYNRRRARNCIFPGICNY